MSFLNPFMLFGIAAIAVPIAIHLLNKRKYEKVVWAAMRFLHLATEQNQRRLRIEDLLLLILRCLLLALLALALARPTIRAAGGMFGGGSVTAVIAIDNSYSMSGTDGVSSRFDNAKKSAEQVLDSLPTGSSVSVLLCSDVIDAVLPEPTLDLNLARKTIQQAKLTDRSTNMLPTIRGALDILKKRPIGRHELYVITDGQRGGWAQLPDIHQMLENGRDDAATHLILVGPPVNENIAVTSLKMAGDLAAVDRSDRFEVTVTNVGPSEAREVRVQLKVDGESAPVDETAIDVIPSGTSRVASLFAKLRSAGAHSITATIASDRLPADDSRTIVIRALAKVKVLLVDGDVSSSTGKTGAFYIQHALLPIPSAEVPNYFLAVTTIPVADFGAMKLEEFDAVITSNVGDFDENRVQSLSTYVHNGGGLVVFPGANVVPSVYNAKLFDRGELLPVALGDPVGEAWQEQKFFTLQAKNFEHPIASIWNDPAAGSPAGAHFYRAFSVLPSDDTASAKPRAAAVLRYNDGSPAVLEQAAGFGRVVLFTSTADTSWNDLAVRPGLFVPLLYRVLGSIVARQDESLNIAVGQRFNYRAALESLGREASITNPASVKNLAKVELRDSTAVLKADDTALSGAYVVTIAGEPPVNFKFAAQADANESRLELLSDSDVAGLNEVATVVRWTPTSAIDQGLRSGRGGSEWWMSLAVGVLLLAIAEPLLGNWFSQSK